MMTKQEYMDFHRRCCDEMIEITKRKNADYAGAGGDPFSNFRQIGHLIQQKGVVEIGFLTRMSDKLSRIASFVSKGVLEVKEESVKDTLLDLANYCILFAGLLESQRPPALPCGTFEPPWPSQPVEGGGSGKTTFIKELEKFSPNEAARITGCSTMNERRASWIDKPRSDLPNSSGVDAP